jgi:parallel beta-helix repeat protein
MILSQPVTGGTTLGDPVSAADTGESSLEAHTGARLTTQSADAIAQCTDITQAGTYELTADITAEDTCIRVDASSVRIDGNGHTINGTVIVNTDPDTALSDITLTNFSLTSLEYGLDVDNVSSLQIEELAITETGEEGIHLHDVAEATITETAVTNISESTYANGIDIDESTDVRITNLSATRLANPAVRVYDSTGITVTESKFVAIDGYDSAIDMDTAENVTLTGNTFRRSEAGAVEVADRSETVSITANRFSALADTAVIVEGTNATVVGNQFTHIGETGLRIEGRNSTVRRNTLVNTTRDGIALTGADGSVRDNILRRTGQYSGLSVEGQAHRVRNNTLVAAEMEVSDRATTLRNNTISNGSLTLREANGTVVTGNTVTRSEGNGINVYRSTGFVINGSVLNESSRGIRVDESTAGRISQNRIAGAGSVGITVRNSQETTLSQNVLTESATGIVVREARSTRLVGNRLSGLYRTGISIDESSRTELQRNHVSAAEFAAIQIEAGSRTNVTNTTIRNVSGWVLHADDNAASYTLTRLQTINGSLSVTGGDVAIESRQLPAPLPSGVAQTGPVFGVVATAPDAEAYATVSTNTTARSNRTYLWRYDGEWRPVFTPNRNRTTNRTVSARLTRLGPPQAPLADPNRGLGAVFTLGTGVEPVNLSLRANRTTVSAGEPVEFTVRTRDEQAPLPATLVIDNRTVQTSENGTAVVRLQANGTQTIVATKSNTSKKYYAPGRAQVTVVSEANITLSQYTTFDRVPVNRSVPIYLNVTNTGGKAGDFPITVSVDGNETVSRTVRVPATTSVVTSVNVSFATTGNHSVTINGDRSFPVTVTRPAPPNATLRLVPAESAISPNESFTVAIKADATTGSPDTTVYGVELTVSYNESLLNATGIRGSEYLTADGTESIVLAKNISDQHGQIEYAEIRTGLTGVNGTGTVAVLSFVASASVRDRIGQRLNLTIAEAVLSSPNVSAIPTRRQNASVSAVSNRPPTLNASVISSTNNVGSPIRLHVTAVDPDGTLQRLTVQGSNSTQTKQINGSQSSIRTNMTLTPQTTSWSVVNQRYEPTSLSVTAYDSDGQRARLRVPVRVAIAGDVNGDGRVNIFDAALVGRSWRSTRGSVEYSNSADLNNDGTIDIFDAVSMARNWNEHASGVP